MANKATAQTRSEVDHEALYGPSTFEDSFLRAVIIVNMRKVVLTHVVNDGDSTQ